MNAFRLGGPIQNIKVIQSKKKSILSTRKNMQSDLLAALLLLELSDLPVPFCLDHPPPQLLLLHLLHQRHLETAQRSGFFKLHE